MGTTEGVKGGWRVNFFIFLLTGSQSVLLPWVPIILKSAGIKAASTGLAVGLSIIFSSIGVGITLQILRRTYSGAVRRIILLVLLLTSTAFYIASVFLIPIQHKEQYCYNYKSLTDNPADSLVGASGFSNLSVSSLSVDHDNVHKTVPSNVVTSSQMSIILYTYSSTVPPVIQSTSLNSNIESTHKTQGNENLNKRTTFPIVVTQTPLNLNLANLTNNLTTINIDTVTDVSKVSINDLNERKSTSESIIGQPTTKISTVPVTTLPNKHTAHSGKDPGSKDKTHKKHNNHNTSGRNVYITKNSTAADIHIIKPEKNNATQTIDTSIDNSDVDVNSEEYEMDNHDQDNYEDYNLRGESSLNGYIHPSNQINEVNSFETHMQKPLLYESYENVNKPISTHYRKGNKIPHQGGADFMNNLKPNQKPYTWSLNSGESLSSFQEGSNRDNSGLAGNSFYNQEGTNEDNIDRVDNNFYHQEDTNTDNKGLVDNNFYNQEGTNTNNKDRVDNNFYPQEDTNRDINGRVGNIYHNQIPQNHRSLNVPSLNEYLKDQQSPTYHHSRHNSKRIHGLHQRQRRSPALRKDLTFNNSDTLIDSITSKKDGLQIDISGETVATVASAGIVTLLIIGGILGSGVEAVVAQLWHCYAHGYDEGGVSQDILERTITHTFHLSVYPQHKRWSTVSAGCWAVVGGMMSAIGCSLGSSSGLWTGQAALHLALAMLSFCALVVIPVPYGTMDPPRTRRPLSLYLDDEVLREGLRRLAFHGWVLISGAVSSISLTFGLWLIQETAYTAGVSIASQACAIFLSQASEGITLHFGHWIVARGGVLGTMCASGTALAIHCGVLWAATDVWLMAVVHVTAGISYGCLWLAIRHNALLLATINDQEREAWVSWCSWRGGMGIGAMLWGSWAGGLSGAVRPLFAAAGAVAMFQAVAVSISCLLGRKQIRSRRRIYHTLDLDMEEDDAEEEDDDEEEDWLVKRAKKEGIIL